VTRLNLSAGRASINMFVSPHADATRDPEPALVALINRAKTSIYFGVYSFTLTSVRDALLARHAAGVKLQGVGDQGEWDGGLCQDLVQAGIDVRKAGSAWCLMHDKVAVVDQRYVATGSFNWTKQAEKSNVENLFIMSGSRVAVTELTAQIVATHQAAKTVKRVPGYIDLGA
jgi:phosphatidylserine/phosphatidylglycerophosphate/cardiolipin synthase-like enzyme